MMLSIFQLGFQIADGGHANYDSGVVVNDGQWHRVGILLRRSEWYYEEGQLAFVVDGKVVKEIQLKGPQSLGSTFSGAAGRIAVGVDDASPIAAAMAHLKIFNRIPDNLADL